MSEKLGIKDGEIPDLSNALYKTYGTTLAGLRAIGYNINYDEYHSFVHGRLPYENLKYDAVLRSLLLSLPYRKVVTPNSLTHSFVRLFIHLHVLINWLDLDPL